MEGYIKLSRKFFSNDMWNEARTFSSCEAWLDLIQSARFEATPRKECIGGREVSYSRGQYPASIRFLSKRWKWTERKVRTFLAHLKRNEMISLRNDQGINVITLTKYNEYNGRIDTASDTTNDTRRDTDIVKEISLLREQVTQVVTQQATQQVTQPVTMAEKRHTGDTKQIKGNNIEENTPKGVSKKDAAKAATLSRKEGFYNSLIPFVGHYPKEMIRSFFDYWSELNKSETKMRFELQKTWEINHRLATWASRERMPKAEKGVILTDNSTEKYNQEEGW